MDASLPLQTYLAQTGDGTLKIGSTRDPVQRMKPLRPVRCVVASVWCEHEMKKAFREAFRPVRGLEWFAGDWEAAVILFNRVVGEILSCRRSAA